MDIMFLSIQIFRIMDVLFPYSLFSWRTMDISWVKEIPLRRGMRFSETVPDTFYSGRIALADNDLIPNKLQRRSKNTFYGSAPAV